MTKNITDKQCVMSEVKLYIPNIVVYGDEYIKLGARVSFNHFCHIVAYQQATIWIGNDVLIGPYVMMNTSNHGCHELNTVIRKQEREYGNIVIGSDVWIGGHVSILAGSTIPDKCVIGAGSVITKSNDLQLGHIYAGNPLRCIGERQ